MKKARFTRKKQCSPSLGCDWFAEFIVFLCVLCVSGCAWKAICSKKKTTLFDDFCWSLFFVVFLCVFRNSAKERDTIYTKKTVFSALGAMSGLPNSSCFYVFLASFFEGRTNYS